MSHLLPVIRNATKDYIKLDTQSGSGIGHTNAHKQDFHLRTRTPTVTRNVTSFEVKTIYINDIPHPFLMHIMEFSQHE
jgi:hypothetical protein